MLCWTPFGHPNVYSHFIQIEKITKLFFHKIRIKSNFNFFNILKIIKKRGRKNRKRTVFLIGFISMNYRKKLFTLRNASQDFALDCN